jgi:hypothetical protein
MTRIMSPAVRLRRRYVTSALGLGIFRPLDFCCTVYTTVPDAGPRLRPAIASTLFAYWLAGT